MIIKTIVNEKLQNIDQFTPKNTLNVLCVILALLSA